MYLRWLQAFMPFCSHFSHCKSQTSSLSGSPGRLRATHALGILNMNVCTVAASISHAAVSDTAHPESFGFA